MSVVQHFHTVWQHREAGAASSTGYRVERGTVQDLYSPTVLYQIRDLGLVTFSGAGNKAFKFTLTGKNPSSNGTSLVFDAISLIRQ